MLYAIIDNTNDNIIDIGNSVVLPEVISAFTVFNLTSHAQRQFIKVGDTYDPKTKTFALNNAAILNDIRLHRKQEMEDMEFEYARNAREIRLGLTPTRTPADMSVLDQYMQDLCNLPTTNTDATLIIFPQRPSVFAPY